MNLCKRSFGTMAFGCKGSDFIYEADLPTCTREYLGLFYVENLKIFSLPFLRSLKAATAHYYYNFSPF